MFTAINLHLVCGFPSLRCLFKTTTRLYPVYYPIYSWLFLAINLHFAGFPYIFSLFSIDFRMISYDFPMLFPLILPCLLDFTGLSAAEVTSASWTEACCGTALLAMRGAAMDMSWMGIEWLGYNGISWDFLFGFMWFLTNGDFIVKNSWNLTGWKQHSLLIEGQSPWKQVNHRAK